MIYLKLRVFPSFNKREHINTRVYVFREPLFILGDKTNGLVRVT